MFVPSLIRRLILESTSVVRVKTPAKGAFTAGVKDGPDTMVTALAAYESVRTARINEVKRSRRPLREGFDGNLQAGANGSDRQL
jgi:hypothetical protein